MRKFLRGAIAFVLTAIVATTAFAETQEEISKKIEGAANYIVSNSTGFTVATGRDLALLAKSGADISGFEADYIADLKADIQADGVLASMVQYTSALEILYYLGYDATNFEGYNLVNLFENWDPTDYAGIPYYYFEAIEVTTLYDDFSDAFANSLVNALKSLYTMGQGLDYYGFSTDTNAYFVAAMSFYPDGHEAYIEDALDLIEQTRSASGYGYSTLYSDANANSTALALFAYSCVGDQVMADQAYGYLKTFESSSNEGVYTYAGIESVFSTKDALSGLLYYLPLAEEVLPEEETTTKKPSNQKEETTNGESETLTTVEKKDDSKKSPKTGANSIFVAVTIMTGAGIFAVTKKHNEE